MINLGKIYSCLVAKATEELNIYHGYQLIILIAKKLFLNFLCSTILIAKKLH